MRILNKTVVPSLVRPSFSISLIFMILPAMSLSSPSLQEK